MSTSRRTFIKASSMAIVGSAVIPKLTMNFGHPASMIGVQLYSVRDAMLKDPLASLTKIAKIGYKNVEHANYINRKFYGYAASEFKKVLNALGLKMPSGHTTMGVQHWDDAKKDFTDDWKKTIEDAAVLEQKYIISPWMDDSMRDSEEHLRKWLEIFNKCGELCNKSGMKFGYHNHDFEFSQKLGNDKVFDIIMKGIDPNLVALQMDIGNMYNAGVKAIDILNQYPGRFEIIHAKDEIKALVGNDKYESTILGDGVIRAKDTLELAQKLGGTKSFIIEQESYQGLDPFDCVQKDLEIIKKWGF